MYKPELYDLVELNKPCFKTYETDTLLADHGHTVLHLPPYHPDLNPIGKKWSLVEDYVTKKCDI